MLQSVKLGCFGTLEGVISDISQMTYIDVESLSFSHFACLFFMPRLKFQERIELGDDLRVFSVQRIEYEMVCHPSLTDASILSVRPRVVTDVICGKLGKEKRSMYCGRYNEWYSFQLIKRAIFEKIVPGKGVHFVYWHHNEYFD